MTITKLSTSALLACALLFTSACDSEELAPSEDERAAELDLEFAPEGDHEHGARKHGKHARMNPAAHLCEKIACSEDQRGEIEALFETRRVAHESKRGDKDARRAAHQEKNAKLAAAFRAEEFDASVLAQLHGERDHGEHMQAMAEFAVELHALLTPEQREQFAEHAPMLMHGKMGRHHGPRHGKMGRHHRGEGKDKHEGMKRSHEQRLAHHVERFCEPLACSEDQQTQLAAAFAGAHEARKDAPKPDMSGFAAAFRADELEASTLVELMQAAKQEHGGERLEGMSSALSEVHAILTPEQRSTVADKIEAEGLHSLMGKKRGKHGKHGKRGKHGKHGAPKAE